ncbi:MAG: UDP-2,3-diacylglucosamine diphosphatase LpxI [Planctomycetia bacterium]|nr:UDP-2,3-diacylglucosamine diphosphatase LpxI [Planctomycetia bacterium]
MLSPNGIDPDPNDPTQNFNSLPFGLIAGWGRYPVLLAKALKANGFTVVCLGVHDHADPELAEICDVFKWSGIARFGSAARFFRKKGVRYASMAGKIHKKLLFTPGFIWKQLPDLYTCSMFMSHFIFRKKDCKDDTLLLTVVDAFERKGIKLLPGTDFAPEMLVKRQLLTKKGPSKAQWKDICFGWNLAREMGRLDVGQSVSVKNQAVLAVEAIEGTDEAIRRAGSLCRGNGFTVVKVAKPGQDMRFDVPTFGPGTVQTMIDSGASVLAVEAQKTIFIDQDEVIRLAEKHNIVIVAVYEEDLIFSESPFPVKEEDSAIPVCTRSVS